MNIYRHRFRATCPNNGRPIIYYLEISSEELIAVEDIVSACEKHEAGFHENIADSLAELGGKQVLRAHHHGVDIETHRSSGARLKGRVQVGGTVFEKGTKVSDAVAAIGRIL